MKQLLFFALLLLSTALVAQMEAPQNWWDLDRTEDSFPGVSAKKAHAYLQGKQAQTVVVAVIDSGVDVEHEDLKSIIWTNPGEVAGNGIDDDNNGYVDDIHGWNFIGGKNGENVNYENLEIVRLYNTYHKKYNNRNRDGLSKDEKAEYDDYVEYKRIIDEKVGELAPTYAQITAISAGIDKMIAQIGKPVEDITAEDVAGLETQDMMLNQIKSIVAGAAAQGGSMASLYEELSGYLDYLKGQVEYNYNVDFDARSIVGDNPGNLDDRNYGNNDVTGPDAGHGTHVAGIIAAVRNNNIGVDGIGGATVRIMSVRTVPNGDERDKDVANAIRYAVDNGASVINMSFGKGYSPYKGAVDEAMKYAEKNDVLLVHAAGNDGKMLTLENNYPNDTYEGKKKTSKTWIEVGAASSNYNEDLAASFSNYNKSYVDVFAPGHRIYSTVPGSEYETNSGTSMAAPMVAGIAALLRSYFPDLTAQQVREVILESALPVTLQVKKPGSDEELISFGELSATGGLANAYSAVKLAEQTKGKKKKVAKRDATLMMF
ncbi:S8 family peptidase [Neolewinella lacunae]|uniref:S8 family peptidase n=1 Tax=Neolewinella lacunae TaxID=1517758 RepID=A0A923PGF2_9BACT|nr:S8 family peptidase [Neolewinella lacunae]MBC6992804.1 S8 family peptidase [Neolewinella lacunae]MDN3636107.1 S8 family peptidase [Neolewinella lacunae]